jgi:hypothetical protein
MPTLSSFTSTNQFRTETASDAFKMDCGYLTGLTYVAPTFSSVGASNNPGNLFGWLIYARAIKSSPAIGTTASTYVYYTSPSAIVNDLNKLNGVTGALINPTTTTGNSFGFFIYDGTTNTDGTSNLGVTGAGREFLYALDYLSYGGNLVIAGTTKGFLDWKTDYNTDFDLIMGATGLGFSGAQRWLEREAPYTIGVFPSLNDGAGTTLTNFVFNGTSFVEGATVADRVFSVYGQKTVTNLPLPSLYTSGVLTYVNNLSADVAGMFTRVNARNELYLTIAGSSRGTILNGSVTGTVNWSDSALKTLLTGARVNYFLNFTSGNFLGSDLVGATASTSAPIVDERVGPAQMKSAMKRDITDIGLKYLYQINNATTRLLITAEIQNYLLEYSTNIDTAQTQVVCNSTNNTDNAASLTIFVSVTPLLGTSTFTLNITLAQ